MLLVLEPHFEWGDYKEPSARVEFYLYPSFPQHLETSDHLQKLPNHTLRLINREVILSSHARQAVLLGIVVAQLG